MIQPRALTEGWGIRLVLEGSDLNLKARKPSGFLRPDALGKTITGLLRGPLGITSKRLGVCRPCTPLRVPRCKAGWLVPQEIVFQ